MARTAAKNADPKNYYGLLEVSPRARASIINSAYRTLAKETHPDSPGGDLARFRAITAAYDVLSNADKRAEYDTGLRPGVGTVIGNYEVESVIAEGGFGTTYKGRHVITEEPVCIKHCSEVSVMHDAVLIAEAKSIWDMCHYALPAMRDMQRLEDNSLALIMSYIPGPTLEQVVEKAGKLEPEDVAWITDRILNVLLYLHHHGIVHGDLKPQNVIVQPDQHSLVLVDFGLTLVKPTSSTKSMGYTPYFAPPEQIDGNTLLPASDFYSLGMIMIYTLSGGDMKAVEKLKVPTTAPDALCSFIKRLIVKDVLARPQGDLWEEFREVRKKAFGRDRSGMKPIAGL